MRRVGLDSFGFCVYIKYFYKSIIFCFFFFAKFIKLYAFSNNKHSVSNSRNTICVQNGPSRLSREIRRDFRVIFCSPLFETVSGKTV